MLRSPTALLAVRLLRSRSAVAGAVLLLAVVVPTVVGPLLFPFDLFSQDLGSALRPPGAGHLLGTDQLGRDELQLLIYGGRYSLTVGIASVAIALAVGVPLGAISGFLGGWPDLIIQRFNDVLLSFPDILLALALVAGLGVGLRNVIVAVGISSVPIFVRLVRASTLSIRELGFVEAARALGVPAWLIVARHVVPNALGPVVVQASVQVGTAILVAAGLGFLGLGVQAPTPEWGTMLGAARDYIFTDSTLVTAPGLAIVITVLGFNLLGDGLRDAIDPRD